MVDPTEMEITAMRACLEPLGEYVGSIGMQRPLADYRREEVLTLVEVVVTAYQEQMRAAYEQMAERDRAALASLPTREMLGSNGCMSGRAR